VPLDLKIDDLVIEPLKREILFPIFKELEFYTLMAQLAVYPEKFHVVETPHKIPEETAFAPLDSSGVIALSEDTVTFIKGDILKQFLSSMTCKKAVFDLKEVWKWAIRNNLDLKGFDFDLHVASYLLDPGKPRYDLEYIAMENKGWKVFEDKTKQKIEEVLLVTSLHQEFVTRLKEWELTRVYEEIEIPLSRVLAKMELRGVKVEPGRLNELYSEIDSRLKNLIEKIYELAGERFNINSTQQLSRILFEKLKLKPLKRTKRGYSTDRATLEALKEQHPLPLASQPMPLGKTAT
jgi:DNA polymerase-1